MDNCKDEEIRAEFNEFLVQRNTLEEIEKHEEDPIGNQRGEREFQIYRAERLKGRSKKEVLHMMYSNKGEDDV